MHCRPLHLFMLPATLLFGLSNACQPEPDLQPSEEGCGEASEARFDGERFCVYKMPIIETRFDCPAFAPHSHRAGQQNTAVCAPESELPGGFDEWVDEQVPVQGGDPVIMEPEEPVVEGPVVMPMPDPVPECTQGVGPDCADALNDTTRARYSDQALAVRLAELLWRDAPDAALTQAAQSGGLDTRTGVRAQVTRMMQDSRFEANLDTFWTSYLELEPLQRGEVSGRANAHPLFNANLPGAMLESTLRTISYVTLEQGSDVRDIWSSREVLLNAEVGALYEGSPATGSTDFVAVTADPTRAGVLTHPAVLSSPNPQIGVRGVYVNRLLCEVIPAPSADVDMLIPDPNASMMSRRERYDSLVAEPACAACHITMDPPGHALHGFDALGSARTTDDDGFAIDASGTFDSMPFTGSADFAALVAGDARLSACMTLRLVEHLCAPLAGVDAPTLAPLVEQDALTQGFTMADLIEAIATSDAMIYRP